VDYTVLRLSNPYGEGQRTLANQGAVAVFLGKALLGEPIEIWGDGSVIRDYIYISDVIDALLFSIAPSKKCHVFNIGSGIGLSLNQVIATIQDVTQIQVVKRHFDSRIFDIPVNVLKIDAARESLGWHPKVSFTTGIERFSKWLQGVGAG
jgi:UDP-glucose 4-epimerase